MYTLVSFVPAASAEAVLDAVFAAGAGRLGDYERCAFVVRGEGRFRPLSGADPFIGSAGSDARVAEDRIELAVADGAVDAALEALRKAHPYEEPAIFLSRLDERCLRTLQS